MTVLALALIVRHLHFFVIISDQPPPPRVQIETRQFYTYGDAMRVTAYDEGGRRLLRTTVELGATLDRVLPGAGGGLYLVQADPGMNGAIFNCDCPWGMMASNTHRAGVNGSGPTLYFYVPPDCAEFTLGAQSNSPNEGARLAVLKPDGPEASVLDGELDREETVKVQVPPEARDKIWSLQWGKSQTTPAGLDDLNFWVEGRLTPLFFPQREWAEKHGKTLWERDKEARVKDGQ